MNKILVVEDDWDINGLLCNILEQNGYEVKAAYSGSEAKMCLEQGKFDLLLLDLMEEFRPFFVDRLVLSMINRKEVSAKDFEISASGAVNMSDDARKKLIQAYQKKKEDVLTHPYLDKKMHIGILFHTQAQLLARFIRGDVDGYPVYIWK